MHTLKTISVPNTSNHTTHWYRPQQTHFHITENVNEVRQKWNIRAGLQITVKQKEKRDNGKTNSEMERDSEG